MAAGSFSQWLWRIAGVAVLLVGGCVAPTPMPIASPYPLAPGTARIWFYRPFFAEDTKDMPAVSIDGVPVGYALWGTNFYRDVPAGWHHLSVETFGSDWFQDRDVLLAPGQLLFIKIASLPSWTSNQRGAFRRGTYYVWPVPPELAAREMPLTGYTGGW